LDKLVVDDLECCAPLQRLDDGSERLVLAHLGELTELPDFKGFVLFTTDLVEKVRVLDKVLVGEVVLNLLTVSWKAASTGWSVATGLLQNLISSRVLYLLWWLGSGHGLSIRAGFGDPVGWHDLVAAEPGLAIARAV
jgi:hypothetical protein